MGLWVKPAMTDYETFWTASSFSDYERKND
jgi:hypothetical protein